MRVRLQIAVERRLSHPTAAADKNYSRGAVTTGSDDSSEVQNGAEQPTGRPAPAVPSNVWARIRDHKVAQWTLAYAAAAYTLLHAVEMVSGALDWPHLIVRAVTLLLFLGLPIAATLAWYHGHRAQHRVSGPELAILTVLLVFAGSVLWFIGRPGHERTAQQSAVSAPLVASGAPAAAALPPDKSIAVLPFVDMSEKKDQEYFGDGLAEEVLDLLAQIPNLKVIARTSSFRFKGKTDDLRAIGAALGAAYAVEGSVRRSGDHIRVAAQLIDTRDGAHRWSESYDRATGDIIQLQDEIAAGLARALQLTVGADQVTTRPPVKNSEAYDLYLRGRYAADRLDKEGFEGATTYFREALKLDPSFAAAAERLADTFVISTAYGFGTPRDGFEAARQAAALTLRLNPNSTYAHASLGEIHMFYDWDWISADRELKRGLEIDPRHTEALTGASLLALTLGKYQDALMHLRTSLAIDPLHAEAYYHLAVTRYALGCEPASCLGADRRANRLMRRVAPVRKLVNRRRRITASEMLEWVPGRFKVLRHVRPKYSCSACQILVQMPAPSRPIARSFAGPAFIAHVLTSKFADHIPLCRQSTIYARDGLDIERSTLADIAGGAYRLIEPLLAVLGKTVLAPGKVHADDTPLPVLAPGTGKTKTGRLWTYVRDDRPSGSLDPPAVLFRYSSDRKGEHPQAHLARFHGFLQADAYGGFRELYRGDRPAGRIEEIAC